MLAALIKHNPKQILKIFQSKPYNINIPDIWQAQNVNIGFKTPDDAYEVVSIIPFVVPKGKQTLGSASYSFNENNKVIETFNIEDIPIQVFGQISDRQFFHALALLNHITKEEALEAVKVGTIPAALKVLVDNLPEEDKFNAEILLSGATVFERNHPLTNSLGQMLGWTTEQIDQLFILGGSL